MLAAAATAAAGDPTRKLFPEGDRKRREVGPERAGGRTGGQAGGRTGGRVRADLALAPCPRSRRARRPRLNLQC
jgi:hypothetical protein